MALTRANGAVPIAVSATNGAAFFGNFPPGEYRIRVTGPGLVTRDLTVVLEKDRTKTVNVAMAPEPAVPTNPRRPTAPGDAGGLIALVLVRRTRRTRYPPYPAYLFVPERLKKLIQRRFLGPDVPAVPDT